MLQAVSLRDLWETVQEKIIGRKFVQDVGILTIASFAGAALSLLQGVVVARWLGPQSYGVAALVMSYPVLIQTFLATRSGDVAVKFLSEFHARNDRDRALAMCKLSYAVECAIALLTFLIVLATADWAADRVAHSSDVAGLMIAYAAAFIPRALGGTSWAALSVFGRFHMLACTEVLTTALRVAVVLGLVLSGWGVAGVIWGNSIGMAVYGIILAAFAHVELRKVWGGSWLSASWRDLRERRREIFRFLVFLDLGMLSGLLAKELDVVILGYFRGSTETGYYKLAKSVAGMVGYVVSPLQSVTYPKLSLLVEEGHCREFKRLIKRLLVQVGAPLGGLVLLGSLLVSLAIPILVGEGFSPSRYAVQALMAGSAVWLACFWMRPVFLALGEVKAQVSLSSIWNAVSFAGFIAFTPAWGFLGMAWWLFAMQLLSYGVNGAWLVRALRRY